MSRYPIILFLYVVTLGLPLAFAGPRLVAPTDPSGKNIRDTAYEFFVCIGNGDAAGAKALFAGPAEHEKLMEAELAVVKAGDDLRNSLLKRFDNDERINALSLRPLFQRFAQGQRTLLMVVNGDDACIAGGIPINFGLDLHREGSEWKVIHLSNHYDSTRAPIELYTSFAATLRDVQKGVEAGKYATAMDALNDSGSKSKDLMDTWTAKDFGSDASTPGFAAPQPAAKASELRKLLGKSMGSPEVTAVIDSLPNVPRITSFSRAFKLCSYETGIELSFNLPLGNLEGIFLYDEGVEGFHRYTGELPYGLALRETRVNVERKIGPPLDINGGTRSAITAEYPHIGIGVHYARPGGRDAQNPLTILTITEPSGEQPPAARPNGAGPRLQIRRVVTAVDPLGARPEPLLDTSDPTGRTALLVSREIVVDDSGIEDVNISPAGPNDPSKFCLALSLNAAAATRLKQVTSAHSGERLAIVFDGRVLMAPTIAGPIADKVQIQLEPGSLEQTGQLAQQIRTAAYALPALK